MDPALRFILLAVSGTLLVWLSEAGVWRTKLFTDVVGLAGLMLIVIAIVLHGGAML